MITLIICTLIVIFISFLCSMTESAVYSVPHPFVQYLANTSKAGKILLRFKNDMTSPVTAVLLLNTLANTAGASLVGYLGTSIFNEFQMLVFSLIFTLLILYFGEIIPKMIGVIYCKELAPILCYPLSFFIFILKPLIYISVGIRKLFKVKSEPSVSTQEILSIAEIGHKEGALDALESEIISNTIELDKLYVGEVQTPRVVVFRLDRELKLIEIKEEIKSWNFSRVPLYSEEDPDNLISYIHQKDIYEALLNQEYDKQLKDFERKLRIVPELMRVDKLLTEMSGDRDPICAVVDEHGAFSGIITLEDILEEIIGEEILDEYDQIDNMRQHARRQARIKRVNRNQA